MAYNHSKRGKLGMFIVFQKCHFVYPNKVNSPPIRQFLSFSIFGHVTCHVTIFKRSAQENLKIYSREKIYFVLGLLARDVYIANRSFEHTFDPGLKTLKWMIDFEFRSLFRLTSGWNVWRPGKQMSLATVPKFADNLILSPYHSKYLHHGLNWRPFLVPLVLKWGRRVCK